MRIVRTLAAGVGAAGLLASPTWAAISAPVQVSAHSPYAACRTPAAGGTLHRSAEVEPGVAAWDSRQNKLGFQVGSG